MSEAQEFNPFNVSEYSNTETQETPQAVETTETVQTPEPAPQEQAPVVTEVVEMNTEYSTPTETKVEETEQKQEFEPTEYTFEWPNEVSKNIYEKANHNMSENIYRFNNGSLVEFFSVDDEQKIRG